MGSEMCIRDSKNSLSNRVPVENSVVIVGIVSNSSSLLGEMVMYGSFVVW